MHIDDYCCMGPSGRFYSCICLMMLFGTGYVLWVELPVQRRLCPIFVNSVGLPDIHEYSAGWRVVDEPPGFGASHNKYTFVTLVDFESICHHYTVTFLMPLHWCLL